MKQAVLFLKGLSYFVKRSVPFLKILNYFLGCFQIAGFLVILYGIKYPLSEHSLEFIVFCGFAGVVRFFFPGEKDLVLYMGLVGGFGIMVYFLAIIIFGNT